MPITHEDKLLQDNICISDVIKYFYFPFRGNFLPNINSSYIKQCKFDFESNMYCPIFKVGDVIRFAQQDFTTLAKKVSVILFIYLVNFTLAFLL